MACGEHSCFAVVSVMHRLWAHLCQEWSIVCLSEIKWLSNHVCHAGCGDSWSWLHDVPITFCCLLVPWSSVKWCCSGVFPILVLHMASHRLFAGHEFGIVDSNWLLFFVMIARWLQVFLCWVTLWQNPHCRLGRLLATLSCHRNDPYALGNKYVDRTIFIESYRKSMSRHIQPVTFCRWCQHPYMSLGVYNGLCPSISESISANGTEIYASESLCVLHVGPFSII